MSKRTGNEMVKLLKNSYPYTSKGKVIHIDSRGRRKEYKDIDRMLPMFTGGVVLFQGKKEIKVRYDKNDKLNGISCHD